MAERVKELDKTFTTCLCLGNNGKKYEKNINSDIADLQNVKITNICNIIYWKINILLTIAFWSECVYNTDIQVF